MNIMVVDKKYIKEQGLYIRIQNKDDLKQLTSFLNNVVLELDNTKPYPEDFRAILVIHYKNKKETIYIVSGKGGILIKNKLYKVNYSYISEFYKFLPDHYFNAVYYSKPELFLCD